MRIAPVCALLLLSGASCRGPDSEQEDVARNFQEKAARQEALDAVPCAERLRRAAAGGAVGAITPAQIDPRTWRFHGLRLPYGSEILQACTDGRGTLLRVRIAANDPESYFQGQADVLAYRWSGGDEPRLIALYPSRPAESRSDPFLWRRGQPRFEAVLEAADRVDIYVEPGAPAGR